MRVLNVTGGISRNAAQQTARRLEQYFADADLTCGIFESENPEFERVARERGIATEFYGPSVTDRFESVSLLPGVGYPRAGAHALRARSEFDLVHVYGGPLVHGPVGALHATVNRCPLITRFNGYVPLPDSQPKRAVVAAIVTQLLDSSRVVFNSHAQKEDVLATYGVADDDHIRVIAPGVEQRWFESDAETSDVAASLGIDSTTSVVGSVMTPRPVKRLDRAFDVLATVAEEIDVAYVILGDSGHVPEYKQLARRKGVDHLVHWAGHCEQERLAEWYSLFDATILTSEWESFGMSITESYLCGTPCVAFDVGGMSDQIVDEETGYLVEPYDLDSFATMLENLLADDELAAAFGAAGREYVRERFTLDGVAAQYQTMVDSLR